MKKKKEIRIYKAIIFDLDGTLIDSLPYHFLSFKKLLFLHGIQVKDSFLRGLIGLSTGSFLMYFINEYGLDGDIEDLKEERRKIYYKMIKNKDLSFSCVKKTLMDIKSKYKIAIATGSSRRTLKQSTRKEIEKLFKVIVAAHDTKRGKPFPDPLLHACKRLKVRPRDCLMVGDSRYDALAAKKAEMDFIGVTTGFTSGKELREFNAIKIIKSIKELECFLLGK